LPKEFIDIIENSFILFLLTIGFYKINIAKIAISLFLDYTAIKMSI